MRSLYLETLQQTVSNRVIDSQPPKFGYGRTKRADHTALRVTGGIGDLILALGPAEALNREVKDVVIYSRWPEIASLFTKLPSTHQDNLEKNGLDVIINLNSLCLFQFSKSFKSFHSAALAEVYVRNQAFIRRDEWSDIARYHPHLDNLLGRLGVAEGLTRYDVAFASMGLKSEVFKRSLGAPKIIRGPYVTIHDGFDASHKGTVRATKTWGIPKWKEFVRLIKGKHPDLTVVQIGGPTSRRVAEVDLDCVGALTFEESLFILENSLCHFDGDSGLTHAAHVLGVPTVALYGPTPKEFFGYPENENIGPKVCGGCWWLQPDWVAKCPMGYEVPECMESIQPEQLYRGFRKQLHRAKLDLKEMLWTGKPSAATQPILSKREPERADLVSVNISLR